MGFVLAMLLVLVAASGLVGQQAALASLESPVSALEQGRSRPRQLYDDDDDPWRARDARVNGGGPSPRFLRRTLRCASCRGTCVPGSRDGESNMPIVLPQPTV